MAAKRGRRRRTFFAMLCWITILGGALIMMGQHSRSEALFYYFRLEDQIPENHLFGSSKSTSALPLCARG
jgi:hypothetical protein